LIAVALLVGAPSSDFAQTPAQCRPTAHRGPFRDFDGLIYTNKPNLSSNDIEPIHIVDRGIWPNEADHRGPPDRALVRRYLASLPPDNAPVVLDFEEFDPAGPDARVASTAIGRLNQIRAAFVAAGSRRPFGFYSTIPARDYWRAVEGPNSARYRAWQRENDRLAPLERNVDMIFPSLYTFYSDQAGWAAYAAAQVCEARRLSSKPVYVFLWPEYHPSSRNAGESVSPEFWRLQLETAHRYADGIVLWGGYNLAERRSRTWDANAPWWRETQRFMRSLD
jgi:hypothetical protein